MIQRRFVNFKDPILSFPHSERFAGIFKPGIYRGFDIMEVVGGSNVKIKHSSASFPGLAKTREDGTVVSDFGILVFKTGAIIHFEGELNLTLPGNSGNSNQRIDYLVCTFYQDNTPGGNDATFSIIQGSTMPPSLTDPANQVIVGTITWPPNTYLATSATYTSSIGSNFILGSGLPADMLNVLIPALNSVLLDPESTITLPHATLDIYGVMRLVELANIVLAQTDAEVLEEFGGRAITVSNLLGLLATEGTYGLSKKATNEEVQARTENSKFITPAQIPLFVSNSDVVIVNSDIELTNDHHGKTLIIRASGNMSVVIPPDLRTDLNVGFIQEDVTLPVLNGITAYTSTPAPVITFVATGVKVRSYQGRSKLYGYGFMVLLQAVESNVYTLLGALKN